MRALVYQDNTLVLDCSYPMPGPCDGEALIRVLLTGICNTDLEIVRGYMGFRVSWAMSLWVWLKKFMEMPSRKDMDI